MDDQQLKATKKKKDWKTHMNLMLDYLRLKKKGEEVKDPNVLRNLKKFRENDVPFMMQTLETVEHEELLKKKNEKSPFEKAKQTKLKKAGQGIYMGLRPRGYRVEDGKLVEFEDELERVKGVLHDFRVLMKSPRHCSKDYHFSFGTVRKILKDPVCMGQYSSLGEMFPVPYGGNAKPIITKEEYDEIQSLLHGPIKVARVSWILYKWKNGKWVAKPGMKELANKILDKRIEKKSTATIAKELEISENIVKRVLKDKRVTSTEKFEALVDKEKWEKTQKVHVPNIREKREKTSTDRRREILKHVPGYRWEIQEKMQLDRYAVNPLIADLKQEKYRDPITGDLKQGTLKEKDGLLQIAWQPYPEKVLAAQRRSKTKRIKKILEFLAKEKRIRLAQLCRKAGFSKDFVFKRLSVLRKMGVVERSRGSYWIKDESVEYVEKWLSQPHIAKL